MNKDKKFNKLDVEIVQKCVELILFIQARQFLKEIDKEKTVRKKTK